jgi:hypothetical protein
MQVKGENENKLRRDHRLTVTFTADQAKRLVRAAAAQDLAPSELCRFAISEKLEALGYRKQVEQRAG